MVKIALNSETVQLGIDMYVAEELQEYCPFGAADYICDMPHKHCGDCL